MLRDSNNKFINKFIRVIDEHETITGACFWVKQRSQVQRSIINERKR